MTLNLLKKESTLLDLQRSLILIISYKIKNKMYGQITITFPMCK